MFTMKFKKVFMIEQIKVFSNFINFSKELPQIKMLFFNNSIYYTITDNYNRHSRNLSN